MSIALSSTSFSVSYERRRLPFFASSRDMSTSRLRHEVASCGRTSTAMSDFVRGRLAGVGT